MKKIIILVIALTYTILMGCSDEGAMETETPTETQAKYKVTFNFKWNKIDFPIDYPPTAHFSNLIGWSHSPKNTFFKKGSIASEGIKNMAELGATSTLTNELKTKIDQKKGLTNVVGSGLGSGVGEVSIEIGVNKDHSAITLATMLAPSPDWYVAIVNINMLEDGKFISQKTINAQTYDAGTDSGNTYQSNNAPTMPKQPITIIKTPPVGNGKVIATVMFTKL